MTKTQLITQNYREQLQSHLQQILDQLTTLEQSTQTEREKINRNFPGTEDHFSVLEELELLTVNLRGYGHQIQAHGTLNNPQHIQDSLLKLQIFNIPTIAQLYGSTSEDYPGTKAYIQLLNYLRLLILEHIQLFHRH